MTSRSAGADIAGPMGNIGSWRHPGRCYGSTLVPALNTCLFVLCPRNRLRSEGAGCASTDQQIDRLYDRWTLVPDERSLPNDPAMLRHGPTSLSHRSECRSDPTAFPARQVTPRACASTATADGRASAAALKLDSHETLRGRQGALVPPGRITASRATFLHSRPYAVSTLEFRPEGHRSILYFHGLANGATGGNISLEVIDPLSTLRVAEESLLETWSAR